MSDLGVSGDLRSPVFKPDLSGGLGSALAGTLEKELPKAIAADDESRAMQRRAAGALISEIDSASQRRKETPRPALPTPPPPPQFEATSPVQQWGSMAMGMAMLGSAFTKRPAINALNAAAGVMNAYHDRDQEAYKRNFDHWKATSDYSLRMYEYQREAYRDALSDIDKDVTGAMQKARVIAESFKDGGLSELLKIGNAAGAIGLLRMRDFQYTEAKEKAAALERHGLLLQRAMDAQQRLQRNPQDAEAARELQSVKEMAALEQQMNTKGGVAPQAGTAGDLLARRVAYYKTMNGGQDPPNELLEQWTKEVHQLTSAGTHQAGAQREYEVKDKDGKTIRTFTGQANPAGGLPLDINTGKPVVVDQAAGEQVRGGPPPSAGGRQDTQITAIRGAGIMATKALKNLVRLPIDANLGATMGVQFKTPDEMATALQRSAVRKFTGPEARKVQITFAGVGRNLATLEAQGRATGLVGLADQMNALAPQVGDDPLTMMRIYAEIRQIIDGAIENAEVSHKLTPEVQELYKSIKKQTAEAVPFTVDDVTELDRGIKANGKMKKETAQEFARKMFEKAGRPLEGGAGAGAATLPTDQPPTDGVAEGSVWRDGPGGKVLGVLRGGKWAAP